MKAVSTSIRPPGRGLAAVRRRARRLRPGRRGRGPGARELRAGQAPRARRSTPRSPATARRSTPSESPGPSPKARGRRCRCRRPCARPGIDPADIDYINAHGTSTRLNDLMETVAVKRVFGHRASSIPMSSQKSMIGHLIGASGAVEAAATALSLQRGVVPPTINLATPDPALRPRLRPQHVARDAAPDRHLQQLRLRRPERLAGHDAAWADRSGSPSIRPTMSCPLADS